MINRLFICTLLIIGMIHFSMPAQARIKCWVNKEGVKECGNQVPPEFSQKKNEELDSQGFVIETKERVKTPEEVAEAERLAKIQEEKERKKEELALQQQLLLDAFSSIEEIQRVADSDLAIISSNIMLTEKRNQKLQKDLDKLIKTAAKAEQAGKQPNESLVKDIESLRKQVEANQEFIVQKNKDQEVLKEQYAQKIKTFQELTKKQ